MDEEKKKKKKKEKLKEILPVVFLYVGLFLFSLCVMYYLTRANDKYETQKVRDEIKSLIIDDTKPYKPEKGNVIYDDSTEDIQETPVENYRYTDVWKKNNDFIGWITVPGTIIDYPVMQTKNNEEYYLRRNFYKEYDYDGVPFLSANSDAKRPSENIVIYGHHMKYGTMFHDLKYFEDKSFYDKHKTFTFDTIYRDGTYEIVSVILTDKFAKYKYFTVDNCNEEEFNEYVEYITNNALYKTDLIDTVKYGDKLVSLSTCEYHKYEGRLVVVGKMIDTDDKELDLS